VWTSYPVDSTNLRCWSDVRSTGIIGPMLMRKPSAKGLA
jgi:hypothetical protein